MSKIEINGSEFSDTNLEYSVCSHLQPILERLERNGNGYAHGSPMRTDKGGGATRVVDKQIDFDLVDTIFEIPTFIKVSRDEKAILCTRCWCAIAEFE